MHMVACMILVRLRKVRMLDGFVKIINKSYLRYQQTKIKTKFAPQDSAFCSVEKSPKNVAASEAFLLSYSYYYSHYHIPKAKSRTVVWCSLYLCHFLL